MRIFISYAREDAAAAEELYQKLDAAGFEPWMDTHDILPGEKWDTAIKAALRKSDFVLVGLSRHSVEKRGYLQKEIRLALDIRQEYLDNDIFLIPVRFEPCTVPDALGEFQWVDLFAEEGWRRLRRAIEKGMERMRLSKPADENAPAAAAVGVEPAGEPDHRLRIVAPDGDRFEAEASAETLVGQLLRGFLEYWSPLSAAGRGRHRYSLTVDSGDGPRSLDPALTLGEAGIGRDAELALEVERLGPESAVGLTVEDQQGDRFTTTVRLDTPVAQLLEAFSSFRQLTGDVRLELAGDSLGNEMVRALAPDMSLFDQGVGNDSLLRISQGG